MAAACFTVFQHIDWLGDTSERWCVTLSKSTPLREECAGIWDWAETKSREQRRKRSIHLSWWQWPAGSSWQQGVVLYLLVLYTVESGISVVDGGKDSDSMLPDTQSTNSPRKTLTSNIYQGLEWFILPFGCLPTCSAWLCLIKWPLKPSLNLGS